jgi:4-amino-4-deoxy-L-arabinose transferase-like glycosyltransferase
LSQATISTTGFIRRHSGIAAILVLALALRLWDLDRNGYGTEYYAAGVRSMLESWHNFLFNSFDPAGFVSVDKPPVALWIQAASAKLLGFSGFSLFLPQALEGAGSILILYHLVQRRFGLAAGLLAALILAVTPISVGVDRANITDGCLVFVLMLAGWAMSLAVERGSGRWLVAALALVGIGFNVKMLAACIVLPGFAALYFYGAPIGLVRRIVHLAGAGIVFAVIALSWSVAYDLAAPETRPYVDSTAENSMLELAVGHNGVQRFLPRLHRGRQAATETADTTDSPAPGADTATEAAAQRRAAIASLRLVDNPPAAVLRLANRHLAGQVLWLLPLGLIGFAAALRQAGLRRPLAPEAAALLLWFGWALGYGIVFSAAGGIFHAYYLVTMAPPLAALAAIGVVHLRARGGRAAWLLPMALAVTAAWQAYIEAPYLGGWDWRLGLFGLLLGGTLIGVTGLVAAARLRLTEPARHRLAAQALAIGLVALLATPAAWALSTIIGRSTGAAPGANIALLAPADEQANPRPRGGGLRLAASEKLLGFLAAHRQGETYLLAVPNARLAAPLIIASGEPVMAMGGFMGTDPILTPEQLAALVGEGRLRYVLLGDSDALDRVFGGQAVQKPLSDWVRANGRPVDPAEWRNPADATAEQPPRDPNRRHGGGGLNQSQLFDLHANPES